MTASKSGPERRKHPRAFGSVPLKISFEAGDVVAETKNISRSGSYCHVNKYIEPMTKLKVQLLIPQKKNNKVSTKKIACEGIVVRSEPVNNTKHYEVAVFFNDISQKDAEIISEFVSHSIEHNK